jgi:hypothetical protein
MVPPMPEIDASPRVFSLEEANALVPTLTEIVRTQLERAELIEKLVAELYEKGAARKTDADGDMVDITVYPGDSRHVRQLKRDLGERVRAYRDGWRQVQDLGAVVKDPSVGLLDFYGRVDDRLVWLCWKYGETSIDYYHELDTGFAGRKTLTDARRLLLN